MLGLEGMLLVVAYATAITASLQAGSRAKYILENNEIGVKDGPLILPPTENSTSPLWDIVQTFQRSVSLGLLYRLDEEKYGFTREQSTINFEGSSNVVDEPYSLSPYSRPSSTKEQLDQLVDMYIEETIQAENPQSFLSKSWKKMTEGPSASIEKFSKSTKYWTNRAWNWRKSREDFDHEYLGEADDGGM